MLYTGSANSSLTVRTSISSFLASQSSDYHPLVDIDPKNVHILDGNARDLIAECKAYEEEIKKVGGIEFFLAGIGEDGHIAFNEPGTIAILHRNIWKDSNLSFLQDPPSCLGLVSRPSRTIPSSPTHVSSTTISPSSHAWVNRIHLTSSIDRSALTRPSFDHQLSPLA